MKNLNIGIIQQSPDIGGAETYMLSLMKEFRSNGNNIFFACNQGKFLKAGKKIANESFEIPFILDIIGNYKGFIKSIILLPFAVIYYLKLLSDFKRKGVGIIIMSGFSEKMLVTILSPLFKIPVVWIEYSRLRIVFSRNFHIPKFLYLNLQSLARKIVVPTNYAKSGLVEEGVKIKKTRVILLGVDFKSERKFKKNNDSEFIIGNVSRLTREKGQQYTIKAIPHVLKSIPNARLMLVGDGPDRKYFEKLIKELNIESSVEIVGFVKNTDSYYEKMDLFVFPTVWNMEGFGLVAVEALSYKIPVVANNIKPVSEVLNNLAAFTDVKNSKVLGDKIISLYNDPNKRIIAQKSYERAKNIYDFKKNSNELFKLLFIEASNNKK